MKEDISLTQDEYAVVRLALDRESEYDPESLLKDGDLHIDWSESRTVTSALSGLAITSMERERIEDKIPEGTEVMSVVDRVNDRIKEKFDKGKPDGF